MANSGGTLTTRTTFAQGFALQDGGAMDLALSSDHPSSQDTISVSGTTRATAWQIQAFQNYFTTVGASAQAILPAALPGRRVTCFNLGANTLTFIGFAAADTIDGSASVTLTTANRGVVFYCEASGKWISALLGATTS